MNAPDRTSGENPPIDRRLDARVRRAAVAALSEQHYVAPSDVLVGIGWLAETHVSAWRHGRVGFLAQEVPVTEARMRSAVDLLERWAAENGLVPCEIACVARARDHRTLQFTEDGVPHVERAFRTHWISPRLSPKQRQRLEERLARPPELVVIQPLQAWNCSVCGGSGHLLIMEHAGPTCLRCAKLDHLVFLPAGDAGRTRASVAASGLSAVVVRFSRSRNRYERQGVLVEESAIAAPDSAHQDHGP